jgi:hypothetical protein
MELVRIRKVDTHDLIKVVQALPWWKCFHSTGKGKIKPVNYKL